MVQHPERQSSSYTPQWEPEISPSQEMITWGTLFLEVLNFAGSVYRLCQMSEKQVEDFSIKLKP
jgi:hypothetical protein